MTVYQTFTVPRAITFNADQLERVEACLDQFAMDTGVLNVLLTDATGQLITFRGRIDKQKTEALAALIAGSHAASAEFIKLLGKKTPFVNLSHESDDYSIYSTNVADMLIFSVAFGDEVKIGIIRLCIEQARNTLAEIVHEVSMNDANGDKSKIRLINEDFDQFLNEEFDKLIER